MHTYGFKQQSGFSHLIAAALGILVYSTLFPAWSSVDVTAKIIDLNFKPYKSGYAANPWDLHIWQGSLYIGGGNSSNIGPARNAGPVPIMSYTISTGKFTNEYTVNDEQIDVYRVIFGMLCTPGHDPKEGWGLGNYYLKKSTGWEKIRRIPNGIHTYDIRQFNNKLVAALGVDKDQSCLTISSDSGKTWKAATPAVSQISRAWELIRNGDSLYASLYSGRYKVLRGDAFETLNAFNISIYPGKPAGDERLGPERLARSIECLGKTWYLGVHTVNDHQWHPFGLYATAQFAQSADKVSFGADAIPWDILARDSHLFVLTSKKISGTEDTYQIGVHKIDAALSPVEIFRFTSATFARSFEEKDGDFYFGMGSDVGEGAWEKSYTKNVSSLCGKLYKVLRESYDSNVQVLRQQSLSVNRPAYNFLIEEQFYNCLGRTGNAHSRIICPGAYIGAHGMRNTRTIILKR